MNGRKGLLDLPKRPRGPLGAGHCLDVREGEEARDYEYVPEFLECV